VTAISYVTTKSGIIGFTRQLAIQYAQDWLRANAIASGWHMGTDLRRRHRRPNIVVIRRNGAYGSYPASAKFFNLRHSPGQSQKLL